jgi:Fe-S cluster assembly ATP-binding protein
MSEELLVIDELKAEVEGKPILKGVSLTVPRGEVHALMGPNGSGKSTLANVLLGHPGYRITGGRLLLKGEDITTMPADERARRGLFLAFQYPVEIPGVSVMNFLRSSMGALRGKEVPVREFRGVLEKELGKLGMDLSFARRNVNEGFSGGEKKRNEVLQLSLLKPELAVLDETDSGLDIDAIRLVAGAVSELRGPERSFLVITHYMRILSYLPPDVVHVLVDGRVARTGGPELARELEETGYEKLRAGVLPDEVRAP